MKGKETWELAQILDARKIEWIHETSNDKDGENGNNYVYKSDEPIT